MGYVTGKTIKELRERKKMTQKELAEKISVSDKTVSKWETKKGLPDIGIIEELAGALGVSVAQLLTGDLHENGNPSANMRKMCFYVCPVCGNIITSVGQGVFSCCGIDLPQAEAEKEEDGCHHICIETVDLVKLYPEQGISVRFRKKGHGFIYAYCNRHGMFQTIV